MNLHSHKGNDMVKKLSYKICYFAKLYLIYFRGVS